MPSLWKIVSHSCTCLPEFHIPWLNEAMKYLIVKLTGLGEIIQDTQMVHPWETLQNESNGIIFFSQMLMSGYALNNIEI